MEFSERYGYKTVRQLVQLELIDEHLRNALWRQLKVRVWDHVNASSGMRHGYYLSDYGSEKIPAFYTRSLWLAWR